MSDPAAPSKNLNTFLLPILLILVLLCGYLYWQLNQAQAILRNNKILLQLVSKNNQNSSDNTQTTCTQTPADSTKPYVLSTQVTQQIEGTIKSLNWKESTMVLTKNNTTVTFPLPYGKDLKAEVSVGIDPKTFTTLRPGDLISAIIETGSTGTFFYRQFTVINKAPEQPAK